MKIYIAAGMGDRIRVRSLADKLEKIGHVVISSWDYQSQQNSDANACQDLAEIDRSNCVIFLTDSKSTEGGRYIEQGYALCCARSGENKRLLLCGPPESCFCELPEFEQFDDEEELLYVLKQEQTEKEI